MRHPIRALFTLALVMALQYPATGTAQDTRSLAELRDAGDRAWTAQRHADALAAYAEVVRRDSTSTHALFRLATLLAWRNDLEEASDLFQRYRRLLPGDDDGSVALGRTLAWRGRSGEAIALYDSVLARNPHHREAALGAAQAIAWSGDLERAANRYERWLDVAPADADAWVGLAQVRQWSGRPGEARRALERALDAEPGHPAASSQLRLVNAALAPSLEPAVMWSNDSDRNRSVTSALSTGLPTPWGGRVLLEVRHRDADLDAMQGRALTLRTASSWSPRSGAWTARGELGATRLDGRETFAPPRSARTEPIFGARVSGTVARRVSLGAGLTRAAFDETAALILSGIVSTAAEGDVAISLHPKLVLSAGGGVTSLTGGKEANRRTAASGELRQTLGRGISAAAGMRMFGYARAASEGYFAPHRYRLAEGSVRAGVGGDAGWAFEGELGLGHQTIVAFDRTSAGRFAERAGGTLVYRPKPGIELKLGGGFANVASPTTVSSAEYRAWSYSLRGRFGL